MRKPKITTKRVSPLPNPEARSGMPLSFKVSAKERAVIQARADKYAGGNLSAYLRQAALEYDPEEK